MDWETKRQLLTSTREQHIKERLDAEKHVAELEAFIVPMYARCIVNLPFSTAKKTTPDKQPIRQQLDKFFSLPANKKSVTIYDLRRRFIHVRNIPEFIRRIERYATFTHPPAMGCMHEREAVYISQSGSTPSQD